MQTDDDTNIQKENGLFQVWRRRLERGKILDIKLIILENIIKIYCVSKFVSQLRNFISTLTDSRKKLPERATKG